MARAREPAPHCGHAISITSSLGLCADRVFATSKAMFDLHRLRLLRELKQRGTIIAVPDAFDGCWLAEPGLPVWGWRLNERHAGAACGRSPSVTRSVRGQVRAPF